MTGGSFHPRRKGLAGVILSLEKMTGSHSILGGKDWESFYPGRNDWESFYPRRKRTASHSILGGNDWESFYPRRKRTGSHSVV